MMKQYDKEFKLHAVQLVSESGKPASQVARELGVSQKTLYGWMSKFKEDPSTPFVGSGNLKPEAKALRDLERENRELREENAILKKAARIFMNDRK
ncbi:transposase [Alicyclobacillus acidoterrestris]|nr:transposase [Alicyclobacillus acidoterrestris]